MITTDTDDVTAIVLAYLSTAIWLATDENGEPAPVGQRPAGGECSISTEEIAKILPVADVIQAAYDCNEFLAAAELDDLGDLDPEQLGHDLWLTRNRHGVGFWDRGLGDRGRRLTEQAHLMGEESLVFEVDGVTYMA